MKKNSVLTFLLCLVLLHQWTVMPAAATQTDDGVYTENTVPVTSVGDAAVTYGCRTLDAQIPLGGSDRFLKSAQSAFIYEKTTQTVIYAYNPDLHVAPASLSKILTALIAIEEGNLSDKITVSTREISHLPVGSLTAKFKNGEILTLKDVLYALVLTSANDAALIIAEYVAGDEVAFVKMMNERARELGCTNTNLTNCHGLDDAAQYTTARDMAKITLAACENETFMEIFGTTTYQIEPTNKHDDVQKFETGNHLIFDKNLIQFNDSRVTGGMPGYVSAASGASISFTAEASNMSLVFVLMGCDRTFASNGWKVDYYGNFNEALDALEYTFDGYKVSRILYSGQSLKTFQVNNGQNPVVGTPKIELDTVLPNTAKMGNLNDKYTIVSGGLTAPIRSGDKIATVQLWYGSSCVAETELFAMTDVKSLANTGLKISSAASRDDSNLSDFLGFLGVLCLIVLGVVAVYLTYNSIMRSRIRAKRRRRRAERRRSR